MKSSIASLGGLKPRGMAWWRRRSFFLKWKLYGKEELPREEEERKGERERGKKEREEKKT